MNAASLMDLIVYVSFYAIPFDKLTFFQLLDHNLLHVTTSREGNHRTRRLMIKLGLGAHAIPQSVLVNKKELKMDNGLPMVYGGFSNVHGGSYRGNRVAIKRSRFRVGHLVGKHHHLE